MQTFNETVVANDKILQWKAVLFHVKQIHEKRNEDMCTLCEMWFIKIGNSLSQL